MIIGVGIDVTDVESLAQDLLKKRGLTEELFTPKEIAYCRRKRYPGRHFAARFCAKEALFKALGSGKRGAMSWRDLEVDNDALGQPSLILRGKTAERAKKLRVTQIHLSLSHTRQTATACVILETAESQCGVGAAPD